MNFSNNKLKIFNEKVDFTTGPRIDARNENYTKNGGNVAVRGRKFEFLLTLKYLI